MINVVKTNTYISNGIDEYYVVDVDHAYGRVLVQKCKSDIHDEKLPKQWMDLEDVEDQFDELAPA